MGCENPEMPALPITFADFGTGFFSFVNDDKKLPVLESNGDIILIGRADSMKRLPETLKYLLEYDKGNIHVFTKSNDRINGIINRLNKMAKDLDHVFIHNDAPRNEMFEIMRRAKCFISGSYKETGPSTMIEAGEYKSFPLQY
jgi:glycosyltransferase involved in cell wall biosynthesis